MPTSPSSSSRPAPRPPAVPFADVCHLIDGLLDVRADILAFAADGRNLEHALLRLREGMRTHVWHVGARRIDLSIAIADYDKDGDLDFAVAGKSGAFLFENKTKSAGAKAKR